MQLEAPVSFDTVADKQPVGNDLNACRALLKGGSRSFYAASFLLPRAIRDPATALYAFCRVADDSVDDGDGNPDVIVALRSRVERIYAGNPMPHGIDRAFARVVEEHSLPQSAIDALIEGFTWDATGRRYQTFDDVLAYAARVAGCVGIMMTTVMGRRSADVLARAADLGVAMQLTNIARDVGEDARNGRLYLPHDWLDAVGIDADQFLKAPIFTPEIGTLVRRLLDEAEVLYARADAGIAMLPAGCRCGIRAARLMYAAIGHEVARQGYDSVSRRAVVPFSSKIPLLFRSLLPAVVADGLAALPALRTNQFLVSAVLNNPLRQAQPGNRPAFGAAMILQQGKTLQQAKTLPPWWNLVGRFVVVLSIFEKLERMNRGDRRSATLALPASVRQSRA
jgi:15-cis-phytoene synthase